MPQSQISNKGDAEWCEVSGKEVNMLTLGFSRVLGGLAVALLIFSRHTSASANLSRS